MRYEDDGYDPHGDGVCNLDGCTRRVRGKCEDEWGGTHWCRQCSPAHCQLGAYMRNRLRRRLDLIEQAYRH